MPRENVVNTAYTASHHSSTASVQRHALPAVQSAHKANGKAMARNMSMAPPPTCISQNQAVVR